MADNRVPSLVTAPAAGPELHEQDSTSRASSQTTKQGSDSIDLEKAALKEHDADANKGEVDVAGAEAAFQSLRRTFSQASRTSRAGSQLTNRLSQVEDENLNDDEFDLRDYMVSPRSAPLDALISIAERSSCHSVGDPPSIGCLLIRITSDQHGFAHKEVGVVFKNLEVIGAGGIRLFIRTFPDAIKEFVLAPMIAVMMRMDKFKKPRPLLRDFNGCAKPGEMVLVLGRPGSGCSTFLKIIANERAGFMGVNGSVEYAGVDAIDFGKRYKGEVAYNQEDDQHLATLTVAQTIDFALKTKTPGKRLPDETKKDFRQAVLGLLLRMLNIAHTRDTLVGNAFVRGVSGGERKRVSVRPKEPCLWIEVSLFSF
jgi:ATP-binding cassette subfamily G (WHITE) protein 2 (SNQ2)